MDKLINVALLLIGVALNVGAQAILKHAVGGQAGRSLAETIAAVPGLLLSPWVLFGMALYGLSVANWLVVLARMPLSFAYPAMSIGYILTFLIGIWLFHEPWSARQVAGLVVIIVGVILIAPPARDPSATVGPRPALVSGP